MADINQIITLGIGNPSDITHLTLFGLNVLGPPPPPSDGPSGLSANSGDSGNSGGNDDWDVG